ncbi:MAG TPA: ClcB-like voltage-gated chloride channel protein [Burkholderiaceae bacterium]
MRSLLGLRVLAIDRLRPSEWQRTLLWAGLIGALGALATIGFREGLFLAERLLYGRGEGLVHIAAGLPWWQRLLVPALGGIVAGAVLAWARRVGSGAKGSDYMEAIALGDGNLGVRASCLRALSSAATVTSGGAIGREGPMVQLAALAGSLIGRWRDAPVPRRRLMVACGAAAGVATAYNAPIAGALFVAEIVLRSLAIESLGPLLVAAFAANLTSSGLVGFAPVYRMPSLALPEGPAVLLLGGLGLAAGLLAPLYLGLLDRAHALFARWRAPLALRLGAGGLVVGVASIASPDVWGNGYSVVNSILGGGWLWSTLLVVLALKLVAVAATTGSGAVGGVFTPTLFVGAVAGALFGAAAHALLPGALHGSASVAIGMGAFLSACTHAPLMSVLMIFEMTESYAVVVPLMLVCVLAYSVSRVLRPASIYAGAHAASPHAPALTMAADLLRPGAPTVRAGQTLHELEEAFARWRWQHVYVLDEHRRFLGAVAMHDLAPLLRREAPDASRPWPAALLRENYPRVTDTTPLWQVLEVFATHPGERLPVVDAAGRLCGHVVKTDLVLMFRERLAVG